MLFSICIPVYNAKNYLHDSVHSILSQSFQDFEIVMVDDGSTDGSGELCDQFASQYPDKIRVIHNQGKKGLLLTRRIFFQHALGEWFLSVDADDCLEEGALEIINQAIQKYHCDLILYDLLCVHIDGHEELFTVPLTENFPYINKTPIYEQVWKNNNINSMCTKAVNRKVIDTEVDYTPWKELQIGEDIFQTYPILDRAESILYIKKTLYKYIKHYGSLTNQKIQNWFIQKCILWDRDDYYAQKWGIESAWINKSIQNRLKSFIVFLDDLFTQFVSKKERRTLLKAIKMDGRIEKWYSTNVIKKSMKLRYRLYFYCFMNEKYLLLDFIVNIRHRLRLLVFGK